MDPLTKDDVRAMLSAAPTQVASLLLQTFAATGVRVAEMLAMEVGDVRVDDSIRPPLAWVEVVRLKKQTERVDKAPIPYALYLALRDYARGQRLGDVDPLWPWTSTRGMRKVIAAMGRMALGRQVGPHSLRAYFVRQVVMSGQSPAVASKLVGHANLQTTMRYFDMTLAERAAAAEGAAL